MNTIPNVALIDDHPLYREGVANVLDGSLLFRVVAQGASTDDALRIVRSHSIDLIMLDLKMPGDGLAAVRAIAELFPDIGIVVLTASDSAAHVTEAFKSGASGYVVKWATGQEIVNALSDVCRGRGYVSPNLGAQLFTRRTTKIQDGNTADGLSELTNRELEILRLVGRGQTNKCVAKELNISDKTVKYYMTNIMRKLQVQNRTQAVLCATNAKTA